MPPKRPASASTAARWTLGVDRRAHGAAAPRRDARRARGRRRAASPPGVPAELGVELALEPGQADRRVGRHAAARELGGALGRRRPDAPGDLRRERAELGQPRLALGERRAVARLDRRARRQRRRARQLLARRAGPGSTRFGAPVDAGAVRRRSTTGSASAPGQRPEDARAQRDGHGDDAVARARSARPGVDAGERRDLRGVAVGGGEALERDAPLRASGVSSACIAA